MGRGPHKWLVQTTTMEKNNVVVKTVTSIKTASALYRALKHLSPSPFQHQLLAMLKTKDVVIPATRENMELIPWRLQRFYGPIGKLEHYLNNDVRVVFKLIKRDQDNNTQDSNAEHSRPGLPGTNTSEVLQEAGQTIRPSSSGSSLHEGGQSK